MSLKARSLFAVFLEKRLQSPVSYPSICPGCAPNVGSSQVNGFPELTGET